MGAFDIVVKNGRVIDGTGNPWFKGDVGINNERISVLGELGRFEAEREIDANGLIVCPGFIDVHTHSDVSFLVTPKPDSKILQGVTTEIVGNCGTSTAPVTEYGKSFFSKRYEYVNVRWDWTKVSQYLRILETNGLPLNVGTLIGHGTVRASVLGFEARDPNPKEIESMKSLVKSGMEDGAFGLSTGLKYAPGCYAKIDEIAELCKVVHQYGGVYATHIRNQGDSLIKSIDEAIEISRRSGAPVQIAHLKVKGRDNWGKAKSMLRIIDKARSSGVDVTFDQYPYLAASTNAFAITPSWAREGGIESFLERIKDPDLRKKVETEIIEQEDWRGSEKIVVAQFDRSHEGRSLDELASRYNKSPESVMCDLLLEASGNVPVILFFGWENDVRDIMTHHAMMVGSDGSSLSPHGVLGRGKPHPRNYGCFPKFFGRYVLKEGLLSVEDGIRRMTSFPAQRYGLTDRGLLREEMYADIVILDPREVIDVATYKDPHRYPEGMKLVLVNGTIAVENGKFTGQLAGKTLRHRFVKKRENDIIT